MRPQQALALIVLLSASMGAHALNRCTDASGKVSYSDKPCQVAEQRARVTVHKSSGFNGEQRPPWKDFQGDAATASPLPSQPERGRLGPTQQDAHCANSRRDYEFKASSKLVKRQEVDDARLRFLADCEGAERARQDLALQRERKAEAAARALQQRNATLLAVPGMQVFGCDAGGCNTSVGRLNGDPRSMMTGPNGITCQRVGPQLRCN